MMWGLILGLALAAVAAPGLAMETAKATFQDGDGRTVGNATLTQVASGVLIAVDVRGLPPGEHGFHFHERGECNPSDGFESAGGHHAQADQSHGFMANGGPHAGDMPNVYVGNDGVLRVQINNDRVSLKSGKAPLLDKDGSALVIHAKPDDYRSQPSGEAGDRIACAVIQAGAR